MYLWIVLCVPCMQRNGFKVQAAIKIDRSDDVSLFCQAKLSLWIQNSENKREHSLQGRHNTTHARSSAWSSSRSDRGVASNSVMTLRRSSVRRLLMWLLDLVSLGIRRGCDVTRSARVRQRTRGSKGLCLHRVRRVRYDGSHGGGYARADCFF
jgi:hypothetical protein